MTFTQHGHEENLSRTHVFQVPVMLTPGEILSINNSGDRNNGDGDFPRNTIIIGSRSLVENPHDNNREIKLIKFTINF